VEDGQVVINGLGLHSLKKYLSLISGYTNKSLYTAIEHLRDKNSVILKPTKAADIYSFGILLYEMATMNRQYRQLPYRDVQIKFA
jgi:serine/threonine protein kinase